MTTPIAEQQDDPILTGDPEIKEALKPLFDNRDELVAREAELHQKLDQIKEARKRIDKILRAGGLLEPYRPKAEGSSNGNRTSRPKTVSDKMVAIILEAAEALKEDEFTIKRVSEKSGKDLATVKKCLEVLREDHVVRLVGKKYPGEGAPDHVRSVHYALIES